MTSFESHINGNKPVVVDFSAAWCGPCKQMEPILHQVKGQVSDKATILKIDIDKCPDSVSLYNIRAVPTLIIFKAGQVLWRKSGITTAHEILQHLGKYIT